MIQTYSHHSNTPLLQSRLYRPASGVNQGRGLWAWLLYACLVLATFLLAGVFAAVRAAEPDLIIETRVAPEDPYVQARVRYTVRLFLGSHLLQGDLLIPEMEHMVMELLGEGEPVAVKRNEQEYQMTERQYLLFPQTSGVITIPGPIFSGRAVYVRGEPLQLQVRPAPTEFPGDHWLPAFSLSLQEKWVAPVPPWKVGDQLERQIIIEADGLTGAQLPAVPLPKLAWVQIQRARARIGNSLAAGGVRGRRVERQLFIPGNSGEFDLPPVTVSWWDLGVDTVRMAVLPGRRIMVRSVPGSTSTVDTPSPPSAVSPEPSGAGTVVQPSGEYRTGYWWAVIGALLAATLVFWLWRHRGTARRIIKQAHILRSFDQACRVNNRAAAGEALLAWGRECWGAGAPRNLGGLAGRLENAVAAQALRGLDAVLYGRQDTAWDGNLAARQIRPALRCPFPKTAPTALEVLPRLE